MNVVPAELSVGFDIRITPTTKLDEFEKQIRKWCAEAGQDVTIEFMQVQKTTLNFHNNNCKIMKT